MTTSEFRARCARLGIRTSVELAAAIGVSRAGAWRVWNGERGITADTLSRLEQFDEHCPRALSSTERRALSSAHAAGDLLTPPAARSNFEVSRQWDRTYARLEASGLVTRSPDGWIITERGMRAINFYRNHQ